MELFFTEAIAASAGEDIFTTSGIIIVLSIELSGLFFSFGEVEKNNL